MFVSKMTQVVILILSLFLLSCADRKEYDFIPLSGEDWFVTNTDLMENASPETSTRSWETVSLPGNLKKYAEVSDGVVWIRKIFDFPAASFKANPVLYLGNVYESDQVYLNGTLIGENGGKTVNFGRPRIYPIPDGLILDGENILAIRLESHLWNAVGILSEPNGIYPAHSAYEMEWDFATEEFIYISFFFFISLFYLLNYIKMPDSREYLSFSIFAFVYCIYEFARNEYSRLLIDSFVFLKYLEYAALFFIPYLFVSFVEDFLRFPRFRYSRLYLVLSSVFAILFLVYQNPRYWYGFVGIWDIHLPLALIYTIYLTWKRIKERIVGAYIHIIGLVYIFYAILKQIFIERGFVYMESSIETSVLFYFFIMTLALRMQFLYVKVKIQKRYEQLREADSLREKVFHHMDLMVSNPLRKIKESVSELLAIKDQKGKKQKIQEMEAVQNHLQPLMDDIIELSRLEVMQAVPFKTPVPFVEFIREVIPDDLITYTIMVDKDTIIENSLELINSIVIRLIDFPGFQDFTHNDLIITQDLRGNIHFRFLLFHANPKIAVRLYNELNSTHTLDDPNTVKWQIIRQIARLLEAKLDIKIIKRKFLRIDLGLQAQNAPESLIEPVPVGNSPVETTKTGPANGIGSTGKKTSNSKPDWRDQLTDLSDQFKSLIQNVSKKRKK
jgi:hypothetical protein